MYLDVNEKRKKKRGSPPSVSGGACQSKRIFLQEDGWLTVLEKNGLGPAVAILENYGIDSETDLLVLDQDDCSKLASRGLKPLYAKKLERWCTGERVHRYLLVPVRGFTGTCTSVQ
jgi:hypothetical protein